MTQAKAKCKIHKCALCCPRCVAAENGGKGARTRMKTTTFEQRRASSLKAVAARQQKRQQAARQQNAQ